jgi:hypothetical protein
MMSDINKIMEAYLGMVSERAITEGVGDTAVAHQTPYGTVTATKRNTKGMKGKQDGYSLSLKTKSGKTVDLGSHPKPTKANVLSIVKNMMEENDKGVQEKKLDPVDDKENDKEFKNRKDKDIDNDGDVDSSDEYLHKKRAATDDAIDAKKKGKVAEVSADLAKAAAKADKVEINTDDDEIIKKRLDRKRKDPVESLELDFSKSFVEMWQEMQEAIDPKKGATASEKHDDHSSKHDKEVIAQHKKSEKKIEDNEEDSHNKVFKAAGKDMKQSPARSGADNLSNGDKTIVNPVKGK